MKKVTAMVGLVLAMGSPAMAQTQEKQVFACIEQGATGFNDKEGTYRQATFREKKFTMALKESTLDVKIDTKEEQYSCSVPWRSQPHLIQCVEKFYFMVINLKTLAFTRSQMFGPVVDLEQLRRGDQGGS
ncbi:hypothetical protein [Microvirga yunnanensis]|uniref:hypothetical protein n=1 Tax=Microvirga yunnanensis TaxID=2953740 RepID=UPI0021CAD269|nr:hypothetical protein [Microvirga sp. HBU65207]